MKLKTCKFCKDKFEPAKPLQMVCSWVCGIKYSNILDAKKENKDWKEKKKVLKEKLKTLTDYKNEARLYFQKWIRQRDAELPCISCGTIKSPYWDSGHFLKAELFTGLIFNEKNVHKQCRKCNFYLNGNEGAYRLGLINRYGYEYVLELEKLKDKARVYSFSKQELINIKSIYKQKIKTK